MKKFKRYNLYFSFKDQGAEAGVTVQALTPVRTGAVGY